VSGPDRQTRSPRRGLAIDGRIGCGRPGRATKPSFRFETLTVPEGAEARALRAAQARAILAILSWHHTQQATHHNSRRDRRP
jgi:hypothetical protein